MLRHAHTNHWTMRLLFVLGLGSFVGCGSAITPPEGWAWGDVTSGPKEVLETTEDASDTGIGDLEPEAEIGPPQCVTDQDCLDTFATLACQTLTCVAGRCEAGSASDGTVCEDGDPCSEGETCVSGVCEGSDSKNCDDDDPCTEDRCDERDGACVFDPIDGPSCDDGEACTSNDVCVTGTCEGTPTESCFSGDCCAANDTPGCADTALRECVCTVEPACCDIQGSWNGFCVGAIASTGCGYCAAESCGDGTCGEGETCSNCPNDCGLCAGCGDGTCSAAEDCFSCYIDCGPCVSPTCGNVLCESPEEDCETCSQDCGGCTGATCGDGACEPGEDCLHCPNDCGACSPGCGDGLCTATESCEDCPWDCGICVGNCCTPRDSGGCDQILIEQCVCASDDYCCTQAWDGVCVAQVETEGCAECSGVVCGDGACTSGEEDCESCPNDCGACPFCGDGTCQQGEDCATCVADCGECSDACCTPQTTPGCGNPVIESCVCAFDSYCCNSQWDSLCVDEVEDYGCGSC